MVMRDGMACGLTMMSGEMPSAVNGMSSCVYVMPQVPFWPWRDENLSPICGVRTERMRTLTKRRPWSLVVSSTWSTWPASVLFMLSEQSFLVYRRGAPLSSSGGGSGVVLPMSTSSPFTRSPGMASPSSSSFL
jgi:hypothetical protein